MTTFTIGFTQSTAQHFFNRLKQAGVKRVIDVRLHNSSQLAGFAKSDDLAFFLKALGGMDYSHEPALAPNEDIFTTYKKQKGDFQVFQKDYLNLLAERKVENLYKPSLFEGACLLCSEADYHHCHRRFLADYLNDKWGQTLKVEHL